MKWRPNQPLIQDWGNISQPMWLVTPMMVAISITMPSAPMWMGMMNISAGMRMAPEMASHGWKLIAAQAVGGRLAW